MFSYLDLIKMIYIVREMKDTMNHTCMCCCSVVEREGIVILK